MKQTVLMIVLTLIGTAGVFVVEPFWGVAIYYLFAVLRPQFMWEWSLPEGVAWSRYVALATLGGFAGYKLGMFAFPKLDDVARRTRKMLTRAHYCTLYFAIWLLLSYLFGQIQNEFWGPKLLEDYTKIFVMYFVGAALVRRFQHIWLLYIMTTVILVYISYEMNYLYLVSGYLAIYRRGFAGLDNNGAALMLAMGVPMCLFTWEALRRWYRWLFLAMIPVIIHAVLMSYSRGAMLSLLVTMPLWWWRSRQKVRLGLMYIAVACTIPIMAGKEIQARFMTIESNEVDASANSRRASWAAAIRIANDYPIFGAGLRGANMLSHYYGADLEGRTIHSQYFQTAADNGWIGLGLYVLMFSTAWLNIRQTRRLVAHRTDQEGRRAYAVACGVEGAIAVFCFGATFLSLEIFELPYLLIFLGAQLPRVEGIRSQSEPQPAWDASMLRFTSRPTIADYPYFR